LAQQSWVVITPDIAGLMTEMQDFFIRDAFSKLEPVSARIQRNHSVEKAFNLQQLEPASFPPDSSPELIFPGRRQVKVVAAIRVNRCHFTTKARRSTQMNSTPGHRLSQVWFAVQAACF
jgi:hypothetical protein